MDKILVVDDNRQIADFLAYKVLPNLGYKGSVAYTGSRALKLIQESYQQLSLVILDWQLPDMTGLDILAQMKNQNIVLPSIIITGEGSEEVAVDALRLGVQDYLIKPVDTDVLAESIDRALEMNRLRNQKAILTTRLKHQLSWMSEISKIGLHITASL
ncbi:MAG: response regulator [Chloroflexi bacterium]|nr:response regulator [Chloroflexota bacterium]